ncbi:MAG TPA: hypothetical protein VGZ90_11275 [Puia sp.]|nr:hypothetical protein [Puia sp.]
MRRIAQKCICFLLLLLLVEKAGLRLFIHDRYHKGSIISLTKSNNCKTQVISQSSDGCVDDFFLAFNNTDTFTISSSVQAWIEQSFPDYKGIIPAFSFYAGKLRGPPSA